MTASPIRWLESYSFGPQLLILAVAVDPIGAVVGYLLAPTLGVDPVVGVYGGVSASGAILAAWVLRHATTNDTEPADAT